MNENELLVELTKWFNGKNLNSKNFWNSNKVGALIKSRLEPIGHWRKTNKKFVQKLINKEKDRLEKERYDDFMNS